MLDPTAANAGASLEDGMACALTAGKSLQEGLGERGHQRAIVGGHDATFKPSTAAIAFGLSMKRNNEGEAVTAAAIQEAIVRIVESAGGRIREAELDRLLLEAYDPIFGPTDRRPWGRALVSKYRQNIASAKSGLDRRGEVIRFRVGSDVYRVHLGPNFRSIIQAVLQRNRRPVLRKRQYKKLKQPNPVYAVPVPPTAGN